ncbi:MAG: hypothetical protein AAGG11_24575 [Pseudomonadota bacterium]
MAILGRTAFDDTGRQFMKLQWLGLATAVVWLSTLLISLSMMWHRDWMDGDPALELLTGAVFSLATIVGLSLGPALCIPGIRRRVAGWHRAVWVLTSMVIWGIVVWRLGH